MERRHRENRRYPLSSGLRVLLFWCLAVQGCAAGMPSIPNSPEEMIVKGEDYFNRRKYFQSQELFKAFIERYAGHDRSDYAQFMLAESYFRQEEYALAAVEYRILATNYGYSEYVDDGFFKEALCNYHQSPKSHLDQTKAYEALSQLEQFVQVFGSSPLVPEAEKYIRLVREKLARKDLENATYYFKRKWYVSALVYLDKVISSYPDNPYWVQAKYLKAETLYLRGERREEAVALLREVVAYPEALPVKKEAKALLAKMEVR